MKRQQNSALASALQISLCVALASVSVILFASSFTIAAPGESTPNTVAQPGFYPPLPATQQSGFYPPLPVPNVPDQTASVTAPTFEMDTSVPTTTVVQQSVVTSPLTPTLDQGGACTANCYIAFQADMTFDSAVAAPSPAGNPVAPAGLTATNWTVAGNVLNTGPGTIKTLRISCYVNDGVSPLNGSGTLYNIKWVRVSNSVGASTALTWLPSPNNFIYVDSDLNASAVTQINGLINITATTPTPSPTSPPTPSPAPTQERLPTRLHKTTARWSLVTSPVRLPIAAQAHLKMLRKIASFRPPSQLSLCQKPPSMRQ